MFTPVTALVVDDEPTVRKLVALVLTQAGYQVMQADDGQDALLTATVYAGPIDVLVSDVNMPHMDGCELADQLRRFRPSLRVVMMTARPDYPRLTEQLAEPGTALVPKPFSPACLLEAVRSVLVNDMAKAS